MGVVWEYYDLLKKLAENTERIAVELKRIADKQEGKGADPFKPRGS